MSNENPIVAAEPTSGPMAVTAQSAFDPYAEARRALRGRHWLVALLAMLGVMLGSWVGWRFLRPLYRSEGLVRIAYSLPAVMQETDQNKPMAMFDTFMQSQRLLISSRRVLDVALQDPIWKSGRRVAPDPEMLANELKVEVKSRSEYIQVSVADKDPAVAAAAVTAIINAYSQLYTSQDKQLERQRLGVLEDRQGTLKTRIDDLRSRIRAIAQEFGTEKLEPFCEAAEQRVVKLQASLADIRTALATLPAETKAIVPASDSKEVSHAAPELEPETLAATDPVMRGYVAEQRRIEDQLALLRVRGMGDSHPQVKALSEMLSRAKERVSAYVQVCQTAQALASVPGTRYSQTGFTASSSPAALRANEASVSKLLKDAQDQMVLLGNKRLELERLQADLNSSSSELALLTRRLETLRDEGSLGGRMSIISTGEIPLSPETNPIKRIAMGAAAGGLGLPAAVLAILVLMSQRYRYSDETTDASRIPLLGILPKLKDGDGDAEELDAVAHCVHQIRVTLTAHAPREDCCVYLVTSAAPGEGKTGLTMALGLSYAMSQRRTLLIDCDWIGRGLTRRLHASDERGVFEAAAAGTIDGYVRQGIGGLSFLAAGKVDGSAACAISAASLTPLLRQAREEFDVVLIDSGPMLGSVEASVMAQEVDEVILTIARGQRRSMVDQALKRLSSLRVKVAGCVFNQAKKSDFNNSWYSSTSRMSSINPSASVPQERMTKQVTEFGPLVKAVAVQLPSGEMGQPIGPAESPA